MESSTTLDAWQHNYITTSIEDFEKVLSGARLSLDAKIEAEQRAEAERIERERVEAAERERIRLENEKLKAEAEKREAELKREREAAEAAKKEAEAVLAAFALQIEMLMQSAPVVSEKEQRLTLGDALNFLQQAIDRLTT